MKFFKFKFFAVIMFVCTISLFSLSSCGGKTNTKTSVSTHTHNWTVVSNTATYTTAGTKTSKCTSCGEVKTESVSAVGHNYASNDVCISCNKYKYTMSLSNTLPYEVSYSYSVYNHIYTKFNIKDISVYTSTTVRGETYVDFKISGTKTYDYKGDNGTTSIEFNIKVTCLDDGEVIGIAKYHAKNLVNGQTYKIEDPVFSIKTSLLSTSKSYTVTLMDYII